MTAFTRQFGVAHRRDAVFRLSAVGAAITPCRTHTNAPKILRKRFAVVFGTLSESSSGTSSRQAAAAPAAAAGSRGGAPLGGSSDAADATPAFRLWLLAKERQGAPPAAGGSGEGGSDDGVWKLGGRGHGQDTDAAVDALCAELLSQLPSTSVTEIGQVSLAASARYSNHSRSLGA